MHVAEAPRPAMTVPTHAVERRSMARPISKRHDVEPDPELSAVGPAIDRRHRHDEGVPRLAVRWSGTPRFVVATRIAREIAPMMR
jgi:hypothetical protein